MSDIEQAIDYARKQGLRVLIDEEINESYYTPSIITYLFNVEPYANLLTLQNRHSNRVCYEIHVAHFVDPEEVEVALWHEIGHFVNLQDPEKCSLIDTHGLIMNEALANVTALELMYDRDLLSQKHVYFVFSAYASYERRFENTFRQLIEQKASEYGYNF